MVDLTWWLTCFGGSRFTI